MGEYFHHHGPLYSSQRPWTKIFLRLEGRGDDPHVFKLMAISQFLLTLLKFRNLRFGTIKESPKTSGLLLSISEFYFCKMDSLWFISGNEQHHLSLCWSLRHCDREHKICHKYTENILGKRFVLLSKVMPQWICRLPRGSNTLRL